MKILIVSSIDPSALESLRASHDVVATINPSEAELLELVADREALIFRSGVQISRTVIDAGPQLGLLIRAGSGVDNVDVEYALSRNIRFERIPEPAAWAVSELSFAMMLGLARKIGWADGETKSGKWVKNDYKGALLYRKTLGILGLGNIGTRVAHLGVGMGMNVIGCVEHPSPARQRVFAEFGITLTDLDTVLRGADFLSVHLPLKASTKNLVDKTALASMKDGAFLVNLARGGIVDERALLALGKEGKFSGIGLDVHEVEQDGHVSPLSSLENVILTPHVGSQVAESQRELGLRILDIIESHHSSHGKGRT